MAGSNWRLANSLIVLRGQLNNIYPNRSKVSDGGIGDEAHQRQGSASDHNAWFADSNRVGVVTAYDFTHDPDHGLDIQRLADSLAQSRDSRIKYLIANGRIMIPFKVDWADDYGWHWQDYTGFDPHTSHLHVSVNTHNYDDSQLWNIGGEEMVENTMEYWSRWSRWHRQITGKEAKKDTFDKRAVGRTVTEAIDIISNSADADANTAMADLGRRVVKENWYQNILDLRKDVANLKQGGSVDKAKLDNLISSMEQALKQLKGE